MRKYIAELLGTMVLVLLGCGSAVFAGGTADIVGAGTGTIGVALAFGLSVVAMAYCIGNISGCHINPAITFGAWISGRIDTKDAFMYIVFQIVGAIIGAMILSVDTGWNRRTRRTYNDRSQHFRQRRNSTGIHRRSGIYFHIRTSGIGCD